MEEVHPYPPTAITLELRRHIFFVILNIEESNLVDSS